MKDKKKKPSKTKPNHRNRTGWWSTKIYKINLDKDFKTAVKLIPLLRFFFIFFKKTQDAELGIKMSTLTVIENRAH